MQMAQMQKKKKMAGQIWKKRLFRRYFSHQFKKRIPQLEKYNKKIKGKSPDNMCWLIFLKIYPHQQKH